MSKHEGGHRGTEEENVGDIDPFSGENVEDVVPFSEENIDDNQEEDPFVENDPFLEEDPFVEEEKVANKGEELATDTNPSLGDTRSRSRCRLEEWLFRKDWHSDRSSDEHYEYQTPSKIDEMDTVTTPQHSRSSLPPRPPRPADSGRPHPGPSRVDGITIIVK
ncbi:hypothetical protein DM02DRAFT_668580 [Periconia macrospinosa]|uniref:Uncharacterized protein n=1 Tax=Periconia macrospinosa TaxID=97972 RepID=A0A2V1E4U0_9PLEO|nr:hypothetical protein DM02DRAFT_668580 [Periconia macrospinosa]